MQYISEMWINGVDPVESKVYEIEDWFDLKEVTKIRFDELKSVFKNWELMGRALDVNYISHIDGRYTIRYRGADGYNNLVYITPSTCINRQI